MLVVWVMSLLVLVFEKDLGTSLLYFGMCLTMTLVRRDRTGLLADHRSAAVLRRRQPGLLLAETRAADPFANFGKRVDVWLDPFADPSRSGARSSQSLMGLGTGGCSARVRRGQPAAGAGGRNDFIFAGMVKEIASVVAAALLVLYLLVIERGLRAALTVRDSFGKLLAGGLAFTLGLQVFVIIGGVSKLIPLTGQTTPFLSAGGSSLVANWLLVAVLLRISNAARSPGATGGGRA